MIHTGSVWFLRTDPVWITVTDHSRTAGDHVPGSAVIAVFDL